ncbi:MAG: energy transducer TonB, partial [Planctomycetes bacterium]|nr:energy transducer TonB [Planctomycetota bacterium]
MARSVQREASSAAGFWRTGGPGLSFSLSAGLHGAWIGAMLGFAGFGSSVEIVVASGEEGVPMVVTLSPSEVAPFEVSEDAPPDVEEPFREDLPELPDLPPESVPIDFPVISQVAPVEVLPVETRPRSCVRQRPPAIAPMPPVLVGTSGERTPEVLGLDRPAYPALAIRRGYEGAVLLRIEVLADGAVGRVEVARTSGFAVLDRAALEKA